MIYRLLMKHSISVHIKWNKLKQSFSIYSEFLVEAVSFMMSFKAQFLFWLLVWIGLIGSSYRIVYDEKEQVIKTIQCGSEVSIQHRASDLCLTMTKNKHNANLTQIGLKECDLIDTYQRWIIHCCDQYLLRCGKYNPFMAEGEAITYNSYFQIQQK